MRLRTMAAAAALAALPTQAVAQEACLTRAEAETLMTALSPSIVDNMGRQCRSTLPADAPLTLRGPELAARYGREAIAARPAAAPIAARTLRENGESPLPEQIDPDTALAALEVGVGVAFSGMFDADSCGVADNVFRALEPLPASNFATLIVTLIEIGGREPTGNAPFRLCSENGS